MVPTPDEAAGELPRAFVVPRSSANLQKTAESIIKFVQEKVATHKWIRGGVVFVDEIPTNPTGELSGGLPICFLNELCTTLTTNLVI